MHRPDPRFGPTGLNTGLKFDRGVFHCYRSHADLLLGYRWTDTPCNTEYDTSLARMGTAY